MLPHPPAQEREPYESTDVSGPAQFGRVAIIVIIIAVAIAWFVYRPGPTLSLAEDAPWAKNWNESVRRSQTTRQPALVLYTADWCPACRQFEAITLVRADVRNQMQSRYTPIMVDLTRPDSPNQALARQYKIEAIPTLVLYNADGRELARTHALPPEELLTWLASDGRKVR